MGHNSVASGYSKSTGILWVDGLSKGTLGFGSPQYFNHEDIKLVQKIKELVKNLPTLHLPLENEYKIIQTDTSQTRWRGILLALTNNLEEKLCRYCIGTFNEYQNNLSLTDLKI